MDRVDVGPPAAVKVQVIFDGGPTGNPGEQPFIIHPKSTAEITLKQICAMFEIEDHYSHFGLYNNETGREVYSTGIVKDSDYLRLKPLPAQKFISRAEVIISKSPLMASKALKHLNDHFIILATHGNNNNVVGNKGVMVVDSVFVSPFLIETIVKVIITKPHFVDLLVRLVNFPKIRVALSSSFLGNARRAVTPASFSPSTFLFPPSSPSPSPFLSSSPFLSGSPSPSPSASPSPFSSPSRPPFAPGPAPPSPSPSGFLFQESGSDVHQMQHSDSQEELTRIQAGMPANNSSPDLQELESSSPSILSSFAYTSMMRTPTPLEHTSKYSRDLGTRKLDVFTLVRDTLTNARLPPPFTDFYRYLLSAKMNEGVVTRCVLLLNCMLGIAELTVVWGDVDESDLVGLPSDITSSVKQNLNQSVDGNGEFTEGSNYGVGSGAANRYVAFKHGIRTAGVIDALTAFAMQENPIAPLRSAISGFQDHLLRPLDMLALGALDYKKPSHGKLLERIWWAAFPDSTYPGHLADDWRFIGFRGNPFLTPSHTLISIHAFSHFARNNNKVFREILIEQSELSFSKKGFPLGALAAHLSSMLVNFYQLGILRRDPRLIKYLFGPDPSELFYRLFDMLVIMMNEMWKRAGFTYAQFLQSVRIMKSILNRAHARDPPTLEALEKHVYQFIVEDFPENANSHPRIVLKRSTFVLDDASVEDAQVPCACAENANAGDAVPCACADHGEVLTGSPRIYIRNKDEDELWRKRLEEEADGAEKKDGKKSVNSARLERFFGEAPEEGYQFAPQPPNVKMVKIKRIFGESVDTNGSVGADPEVKEYNKRYRDSLNEDQLKKLEVERAHRLHAFFGEWFDTTDANRTIKHTKKPSFTSPDITDLVVIKKISIPPPNASPSSSSESVPTIHLSVHPPNDFTASPDSLAPPQTQTLSLALNPLLSPSNSPCGSPRNNTVLEPSTVPDLSIVPSDSNVSSPRLNTSSEAIDTSQEANVSSGSTSTSTSTSLDSPPDVVVSSPMDIAQPTTNNSNEFDENREAHENDNNNNNNTNNNNEHINNENDFSDNSNNNSIEISEPGSSSSSANTTPTIHPSPILSPLGRSSSTPTSPSPPSSPSRSHRADAAWRPALNRTTSAPLNNSNNNNNNNNNSTTGGRPRAGSKIGTRTHTQYSLRGDDTASISSAPDDTASYISNTDSEMMHGEEERPRSNSGSGKGLSFFRLSRWFSKNDSNARPPSPTTNKRLKRNILKQLFGDRINKGLTDLMNEPSIQHEKTASSTRRDRHRPSNNVLTPASSSSSVSSTSSFSSSAPSSASSSPQHSPPNFRNGSPSRPASPSGRVRETTLETDNQALARFRFMNRMKSKSSTSIPMASPHHPSAGSPPSPSPASSSKRYHTFATRKPAAYPRLQVYQI